MSVPSPPAAIILGWASAEAILALLTSAFRTRFPMYTITVVGNVALPRDLETATDDDVEDVLRSAATHLGRDGVEIRRVSSVLGGSCIACVDVVAYVGGTALLVARPALY